MVAGYPGIGGLMRPSFYRWLFRRWVDQWWVVSTERYGMPHMSVKVPPNTPGSTRASIRSQLEDYVAEHVGVFEEGVELLIDATANAAKSYESYKEYMEFTKQELTTLWLGSSDAASPGPNGSRASQETRTGALLDPRMVSDGMNLGSSLQNTLIRSALHCNRYRFSVPIDRVPVPSYKFRTQEDEAQVEKVPPSELIELVRAVKSGEITPAQAIEIIMVSYPQLPREQAQKLVASGAPAAQPKTLVPVPAPSAAKPTDKPALAAPAGEDVQSQALNGAQLAELKQLAIDVRQGLLPRDSAIALVRLAVPGADEAAIAALIPQEDPTATPAPKQPPPFAPQKEAA